MKRVTLILAAAAVVAAIGVSAAAAAPAKARTQAVSIVMSDPGCHWFAVDGKLKSKLSVTGATMFRNLDEAPLVFVGKHLNQHVAVGKSITLGHGVYHITMVGQAADDNHLLLRVK